MSDKFQQRINESTMAKTLAEYASFARDEIMLRTPPTSMREHAAGWRNVLPDIYRAGKNPSAPGGIFEVTALVISRWEFLGGLYCGETMKTDAKHAVAFARRFLPKYDHVHNLSGDPSLALYQSEFFGMLRNKPLHGFTPAGVLTYDGQGVMGWGTGSTTTHLAVVPGGVLVDCLELAEDLCKAMEDFADVLDTDAETVPKDNRRPCDRWKRAFWARFCPIGKGRAAWMTLGEGSYGIPT